MNLISLINRAEKSLLGKSWICKEVARRVYERVVVSSLREWRGWLSAWLGRFVGVIGRSGHVLLIVYLWVSLSRFDTCLSSFISQRSSIMNENWIAFWDWGYQAARRVAKVSFWSIQSVKLLKLTPGDSRKLNRFWINSSAVSCLLGISFAPRN